MINRFFVLVVLFFYFSPLQSATTYVPVYTGWNDPGSGLNQCLSKQEACSAHGALAHLNASGQCVYNVGYGDQIIYLQQCGKSCGANSTGNNTLCTCDSGYEWLSGNQCVSPCGSGTVRNPSTQQCQAPCPAADTVHSEFESAPGEYHTGSYCVNGCAVRSEVVADICGSIDFPGAECSMAGHIFTYTGQMCGGDNPPPSGPINPPGCTADKDLVGNLCMPKCAQGTARDGEGYCKCSDPTKVTLNGQCSACTGDSHAQNGVCVSDPTCSAGQEKLDHQCYDKCPSGQYRSGSTKRCVSCASGTRLGTDPITGVEACVTLQCPDGQMVSYLQNKCVDDPNKSCPVGQHKDGTNCVPDKPQECQVGQYWLPACARCVNSGEPIPQCSSLQNGGDIDGDGQPNNNDPDMDGDGQPNNTDPDKDGDGIPNASDSTPGGPGTTATGPGTNDIDGDGIPNDRDGDIDGDGVPNSKDGTPNGTGEGAGGGEGDCDPNTTNCDPTKAGEPAAGPGKLYEKKDLKFSDVWKNFTGEVKNAPIFRAGSSFFSVPSSSGTCPTWKLEATRFWDTITIDFQCSAAMADLLRVMGLCFLLGAAWTAFYIAFL